jgi:hypothetical protein
MNQVTRKRVRPNKRVEPKPTKAKPGNDAASLCGIWSNLPKSVIKQLEKEHA